MSCMCAQLCPTLCDLMDYSLPGCSLHVILQARILQWVIISSFRGSSQLKASSESLALQVDTLPLCHLGSPIVIFYIGENHKQKSYVILKRVVVVGMDYYFLHLSWCLFLTILKTGPIQILVGEYGLEPSSLKVIKIQNSLCNFLSY